MKDLHLHLVSDSTGATLQKLAEAALVQFPDIHPVERLWPLVRSETQMERMLRDLEDHPGPVLYTLVDPGLTARLQNFCQNIGQPCIAVLDPIIEGLSRYLGQKGCRVPGLQHRMDDEYFRRVEAVAFALRFDDGQSFEGIDTADVVLVGVSRTTKTPTCIYLSRLGIRAANIPLVPGQDLPENILSLEGPLFIGLTESPDRLLELRGTRLKSDQPGAVRSNYTDPEKVEEEIADALKLFRRQGWPVIDVTRRSIEETAAEILVLLQRRRQGKESS
jgi:regulator of PEP synthase PpsR (kinase-PPPase family)